jgi:hypothetical protein
MQPLYTEQEFKLAKSRQLLPLKCLNCSKTFYQPKNEICNILHGNPRRGSWGNFCSRSCARICLTTAITILCEHCHKPFKRHLNQIKSSKHHFCSRSCACTYHNAHKTKGTRVSKLEIWLSKKLPKLYPALEFHFNRKDTINGELDIYIPSLRLAFELNGVFHYEPIFGKDKLSSIQNNDTRKAQACLEHNIELCLIDVSSFTYFKEQRAKRFLIIIQNIINSKLSGSSPVIKTVSG